MNRRPAGVVICAVVLGLTGAIQLLFAVLSGVAAVIAPKMPAPAQAASTSPPAGFLLAIMLFSTVFYLVLAGWAGATMVGLLRMRPWSRISMIVIGAGLILAGLFGALGMSAAQLAIGSMPLPPNADPRILHITFILLIILALLVVGLGVWWVVYFALSKTRNAFSLAEAQRANATKTGDTNLAPVSVPGGTQAQSFYPADANPAKSSRPEYQGSQPFVAEYASATRQVPAGRPVSITVLAILLLIGSLSALFQMLSPLPLFMFGVILTGWPAHITMLMWCAVNGVSGIGLLKLEKPAWTLAFGVFCLPVLNSLMMLLPGGRAHFAEYMQTVLQRSSFGLPAPHIPSQMMAAFAILGVLVAVAMSGVVLTLLWRAKWAFEPGANVQAAR